MEFLKNPFLVRPFIILGIVLGLDKLLLLQAVREYTTSYMHIEDHFYDTREDLLNHLKEHYTARKAAGEKLGLIFGTSRSGEFDSAEISKVAPKSYTYNFSAPQAGHSYHAYWLQRILEQNIRPDFVLLESDPITLSPNANRFPIKHSLDISFLLKHIDFDSDASPWRNGGGFSTEHFERFLLSRMFAAYRFPVDLRAAARNRESHIMPVGPGIQMVTGLEIRRAMLAQMKEASIRNLGGIPNPHALELPENLMNRDAETMASLHLPRPYHTGRAQTRLFREMLEGLARESIPTVVFWPPVVSRFREIMRETGAQDMARSGTTEIIERLGKDYPKAKLRFVEADSKGMQCRIFFDSIHIAGKCYPELTKLLLKEIQSDL